MHRLKGPGLVSISSQRRFFKRKYLAYVKKDKMKKIRIAYLNKIIEVLLAIYLNGTTIDSTAKDVT